MNMTKYALAAGLAAAAGCAWSDATIAVHGRAGMPVGSDRHAYIVDTARPPAFAAQLQAQIAAGRAGGPAAQALANARAARADLAGSADRVPVATYGRAGYVPDFLAPAARQAGNARVAGANHGASAEHTH